MKKSVLLVSLFVILLINVQSQIVNIDSIINSESSRKIIEFLASDSLKGRFAGSNEAEIAADFIAKQFKKAGLKPIAGYDSLFMPFAIISPKYKKDTCYNVLAGLQGKNLPNETIIFSAHYDHIGTLKTNPFPQIHPEERKNNTDSIYNGANDDASGICALILLARYFATLNNNNRTIIFVAFSGEELGLLGSAAMAELINPRSITAVINIEMIGRKANLKNNQPFVTGDNFSNLILILNDALKKNNDKGFADNFFLEDPFTDEKLFYRSDNITFAKLGIPSHSIMLSSGMDRYYHSVKDEPDTLDYEAIVNVIKAVAISTQTLIDGSVEPKRIQKEKLNK